MPNNATIKQDTYLKPNRNQSPKNLRYPYGDLPQKDTLFNNIDYKKLKTTVNDAFIDTELDIQKTRSVLVVYKDQIIADALMQYEKHVHFLHKVGGEEVTSFYSLK